MNYTIDRVFKHAKEYLNKLCQEASNETISKRLDGKNLKSIRKELIDYYVSRYFELNKNLEDSFVICGKFDSNPASLEFYMVFVKNSTTGVYHGFILTKKDALESNNPYLEAIIFNFHKDQIN
jgi:hypothetical protein